MHVVCVVCDVRGVGDMCGVCDVCVVGYVWSLCGLCDLWCGVYDVGVVSVCVRFQWYDVCMLCV